ncbi:CAP domain-containing protein [Chloroflexota bacterium]
MNNREAGKYDSNPDNHPPTCTCAECTKRRLNKKKQAIWSNLGNYFPFKKSESERASSFRTEPTVKHTKHQKLAFRWLIPTALIFSCTLIGFGISLFIGTAIPLWLLLGFSLIFSIEKWFHYATRKHKYIGKLYRLLLNLAILCFLSLIIWSGTKLFSQQYFSTPLVGSLLFLAEFVFFIWMWRTVSKNSWRWPSMKLTVFSLICLFLIFSFAGVQPMTGYKDYIVEKAMGFFDELKGEDEINSELDNEEQGVIGVITGESNENEGGFIDKAIDTVDDLWETSVDDYANKFNQYRKSEGLPILEFTDDLNRVAELRLKELYTDYSHYSAGNYNEHLAENIAMSTGFLSNSDALSMWQNSPGHNANMLDSSYKYTGYAIGNGYAVQVFTEYITIDGEPQLPPGWYWTD